jgi:hypothetical protein
MTKARLVLILFLAAGWLFAQDNGLKVFVDTQLGKNADYQQALNRFEKARAVLTIENSLNWFDINFSFRQYDNNYTREEENSDYEYSTVNEKDTRWRVELEKQLFPKDFDHVSDMISSRMDLLRYRQELKLAYTDAADDILSDLIDWYEVELGMVALQSRLDILYNQKQVLEDMDLENLVSPETLILNLEEIDDKEDDLYDYKKLAAGFRAKYGNILPEFTSAMQTYLNAAADTLSFMRHIEQEHQALQKDIRKLAGKIRSSYFHFYLPEMTMTLSYNKRETRQDWDIERNGIFKTMLRRQDEEFPEAEIELSLPFNIFTNTSGKLALLKAYERELRFRGSDLQEAWESMVVDRLASYHAATLELNRKTRLNELYGRHLSLQLLRYGEEPSLLGSNPELKLQRDTLKANEMQTDMRVAEMKLYKEIFLINNLGEVRK